MNEESAQRIIELLTELNQNILGIDNNLDLIYDRICDVDNKLEILENTNSKIEELVENESKIEIFDEINSKLESIDNKLETMSDYSNLTSALTSEGWYEDSLAIQLGEKFTDPLIDKLDEIINKLDDISSNME